MAPRFGLIGKLLLAASSANAYFLFAHNNVLTTERLDPIVNPGGVSGHAHSIYGGSNFRATTNTSFLQQSECTTSPIKQDNSNYWSSTLYFQWKNGSFSSVNGNPVIYYLYSDTPGVTTPFPDNFRMISGTPTLRSYDASSAAQRAVTFLCLNFNGVSTTSNDLPSTECPSGIRAQINFPSCWDGVNTDSADHKSHVAFLSGGPDSGTCSDPKFPKTLPRIFMEMYLDTGSWWAIRDQAMNPNQPFVYSMGDPTGYGYHADFINGWEKGTLQNVVDKCHCNEFGDPTCCSDAGIFDFEHGGECHITKGVNEVATGMVPQLPGNNPVVPLNGKAANLAAAVTPSLIEPVFAYTGDTPPAQGKPVGPAVTNTAAGAPQTPAPPAATTAKAATSTAMGAQPTSGSGSPAGSGSGSPAGSGSGSPAGSGSGSPASSGSGSNSGSGSSPNSGSSPSPGSGSGSPATGSSSGSNSSSGSAPPPKTCKKTKRSSRTARSLYDAHAARHRRFTTPFERFPDHEF